MAKVKIERFRGILYSLSAQLNISILLCPLRLFERLYHIRPFLYTATKSPDGIIFNGTEIIVQLLNPVYSFPSYWVAGRSPYEGPSRTHTLFDIPLLHLLRSPFGLSENPVFDFTAPKDTDTEEGSTLAIERATYARNPRRLLTLTPCTPRALTSRVSCIPSIWLADRLLQMSKQKMNARITWAESVEDTTKSANGKSMLLNDAKSTGSSSTINHNESEPKLKESRFSAVSNNFRKLSS
jgi:hypothetical protein